MKNIRHGDVNLYPVKKVEGEIIEHDGTFAVELGETTGHVHRLSVKNKEDLIIRKDSFGNYYFTLLAEGVISHEEHKPLIVPKGTYKKIKERELDFAQGLVRKVID